MLSGRRARVSRSMATSRRGAAPGRGPRLGDGHGHGRLDDDGGGAAATRLERYGGETAAVGAAALASPSKFASLSSAAGQLTHLACTRAYSSRSRSPDRARWGDDRRGKGSPRPPPDDRRGGGRAPPPGDWICPFDKYGWRCLFLPPFVRCHSKLRLCGFGGAPASSFSLNTQRALNFARRDACFTCGAPRGADALPAGPGDVPAAHHRVSAADAPGALLPSVIIQGVEPHLDEEAIRMVVTSLGHTPVKDLRLPRPRDPGADHKGYCFVDMYTMEAATRVVALLDGQPLAGQARRVRVS